MTMSDWDLIENAVIIAVGCLYLLFLLSGKPEE